MTKQIQQIDNTPQVGGARLSTYLLKGNDVKRSLDENWLNIFDRMHSDLPDRYKVDFLHQVQLSGADPRKKQIHLTSYFSKKVGTKVGVPVYSYHFFLDRANQTKEMDGLDVTSAVEEVFDPISNKMKKELVSTAVVSRKGRGKTTFKARWSECYNPKNSIWKERPYQMLEKTAIANVLRWAFPETMSGMYIEEEISPEHDTVIQAEKIAEQDNDIETTATKIEKEDEIIEEIKKGGRKTKAPLLESLKSLAGDITKGFTLDQKIEWMQKNLGVDSFQRLESKKIGELETLVLNLKEISKEPIVMPD